MKRILVWDLPIRLFHWILTGSFVAAFIIALTIGHRNPLFAVHMLLGGVMAFMVLLRIIWGFVGSRWARFDSFVMRPAEILGYLGGIFTGHARRYTGHNPGSSLAAYLMFGLLIGLAVTGLMLGNGAGDAVEELHELMAWAMVLVVGAHLLGILVHTFRHRENIAASMVDGRKKADPAGAIASTRPVVALVFLILTAVWTVSLVTNYDAEARRLSLPLVGVVMDLGHGGTHH